MNTDVVYLPLNVLINKFFTPLNLVVRENQQQLKIVSMDQMNLSNIDENERIEIIESLSNVSYPLYFYFQLPEVYLAEFEQFFKKNKNEYIIISEIESNYFIYLKIQNRANLKIVIKELAWLNGSGYKLLWSADVNAFNSHKDEDIKSGTVRVEEDQTIFFIGEPEDLLIIISNEHRFKSFNKLKEVLPPFIEPTFYDYD
ncbi:hypothetical protein JOC78_001020 [Bacillus ectoiniformans]|uniref:hypothetical protein n=1 Tax=Bacillus ectoiniformans TaxID=1494429 RepID=UPI00195C8F23|nr:hypothetical protein [Bacillus ectoiniformans]MBM7648080.1 hypothetical protein [Bacillus ectoiniformans]